MMAINAVASDVTLSNLAGGETLSHSGTATLGSKNVGSSTISNLSGISIANGTGAASYEWYWEGLDGAESTSTLRGPNLLGAELLMDFPTEDYEVFTTEEIEELNEALGTANLTENEIWDVISGM